MFEVYLDGLAIRQFETEEEAKTWCLMYDGCHEPSYEKIEWLCNC